MRWLWALGGYDGALVAELFEPRHRLQLALVGFAVAVSAAAMAGGCAALTWYALASRLVVALVAVTGLWFFATVLRLLGAGSGVHPRNPTVVWRMSPAALLVPLLWAGLTAQPLLAVVLDHEADAALAVQEHQLAALADGPTGTRVDAVAAPHRPGPALALRLGLPWQRPWRAAALTAVFTLLGALQPLLRLGFRTAGRAYARRHAMQIDALVQSAYAERDQACRQLLATWGPAAVPEVDELFLDPPYCHVRRRP